MKRSKFCHTTFLHIHWGGWNAIRYQILDPQKNQISDIRPPKKSNIRYHAFAKIRYLAYKNQISNIRYQISDTNKNQLSDIRSPKNQISDIKVPRSTPPPPPPYIGSHIITCCFSLPITVKTTLGACMNKIITSIDLC